VQLTPQASSFRHFSSKFSLSRGYTGKQLPAVECAPLVESWPQMVQVNLTALLHPNAAEDRTLPYNLGMLGLYRAAAID